MQRWIVAIVIWAATAVTISAQTLVIPVSANADGVNQTKLRTDLQVRTQGDAAAPFTIEILETGADNSEPTTMDRSIGIELTWLRVDARRVDQWFPVVLGYASVLPVLPAIFRSRVAMRRAARGRKAAWHAD